MPDPGRFTDLYGDTVTVEAGMYTEGDAAGQRLVRIVTHGSHGDGGETSFLAFDTAAARELARVILAAADDAERVIAIPGGSTDE